MTISLPVQTIVLDGYTELQLSSKELVGRKKVVFRVDKFEHAETMGKYVRVSFGGVGLYLDCTIEDFEAKLLEAQVNSSLIYAEGSKSQS